MAQEFMISRRTAATGIGMALAIPVITACGSNPASAKDYPYSLSEAQWRKKLSKDEFYILREAGTERPFTSPLNKEKRSGIFACAGCGNKVYPSKTKYDSKTGWPSFWAPVSEKAIGTSTDFKLGYPRTEVHCARCGGHLGHIFSDGPKPTGKRHCINGLALDFIPA